MINENCLNIFKNKHNCEFFFYLLIIYVYNCKIIILRKYKGYSKTIRLLFKKKNNNNTLIINYYTRLYCIIRQIK